MNNKLNVINSFKTKAPKQKLPGFIRWPLRILAYPIMILDVYSQKFVRLIFKSKYVLEGQCKMRGNCCQFIHMSWPNEKKKLSLSSKIYIFWQREVLGFYFRDFDFVEDNEVTKVMSCRYLKNGKCSHYRLRPAICRDWPKYHPFRKQQVLKGCGFKPVLRKPEKTAALEPKLGKLINGTKQSN